MKALNIKAGTFVELAPQGGIADHAHVFDQESIDAVNAAVAARRPLLVRGEPGVGKSQLARAVARKLDRALLVHVVDIRTEARDLLWEFDAVARLAEAQISGALGEQEGDMRKRLATERFLKPGPLWWAFAWKSASDQAKTARCEPPPLVEGDVPMTKDGVPKNGTVVLVDEIDKAETDVPNGLLEALGAGSFVPFGKTERVSVGSIPPLVIITSNRERALPDAFVRRCLVLHMKLPDLPNLLTTLQERGHRHFPGMDPRVLGAAAQQLAIDRDAAAKARHSPKPGQAEYLDMLRALHELYEDDAEAQIKAIESTKPYIFEKHLGAM